MRHSIGPMKIAPLMLMLLGGPASAATWAVDDTVDTPVGQACPAFSGCSLREALTSTEMNPGADAILVSQGTYAMTQGQLNVTQEVTISRVGAGGATIDGGGSSRLFDVTGTGILTLRFLTVRNGRASGATAEGGAIRGAAGSSISIQSTTLTSNVAEGTTSARGGAISSQGNIAIGTAAGSTTPSQLLNNTARVSPGAAGLAQGGAVWAGGTLTVGARSRLQSNLAEALDTGGIASGGAVHGQSTVAITQTTVAGNSAQGSTAQGGGIAAVASTIMRSTLSGNSAQSGAGNAEGGGLWSAAGGSVDADFSTFADNTATVLGTGNARGGAVFAPTMTLSNSTIAANEVAASGPGDARGGGLAGTGVFTTLGSIVSGNSQTSGDDCFGGAMTSLGYTLLAPTTDCGYVAAVGDILSATPNLQVLASNGGLTQTIAVFPDSPAYNAIPAAAPDCVGSSTDQRGSARPSHGSCEIGAYEGQTASDIRVLLDDGATTVLSGQETTYTLTVLHNGEIPLVGATLVDPAGAGLMKTAIVCIAPAGCVAPSVETLEAGYTLPSLPAAQNYQLEVTAQVTAEGNTTVTNTATVALPPELVDSAPGNNSASDVDTVLSVGIFADGFEG